MVFAPIHFAVLVLAAGWGVGLLSESRLPGDEIRTDLYGDPLPAGAIARCGTIRLWHGPRALAVAYSPDGKSIATAGADRRVRIWDTRTGKQIREFGETAHMIADVVYSPDGTRLASIDWAPGVFSRTRAIRIWNPQTGQEELRVPLEMIGGTCLAFSADGRHLASAGHMDHLDGIDTIHIWDVATGKLVQSLEANNPKPRGIHSVAFSADGRKLGAGGICVRRLQREIAIDNRHEMDFTVYLWSLDPAPRMKQLDLTYLTSNQNQSSRSYIGFSREPLRGAAVAFHPDGKSLAVGTDDGTIRILEVPTTETLSTFTLEENYGAIDLEFTGGGTLVATTGGQLALWKKDENLRTVDLDTLTPVESRFAAAAYAPDGALLTLAFERGALMLVETATGQRVLPSDKPGSLIRRLAFAPDRRVLAALEPPDVRLWETETGRLLRTFEGLRAYNISRLLAYHPDGKLLLCQHEVSRVGVFSSETGALLRDFRPDVMGIQAAALSADGRLLCVGGRATSDFPVFLYDVASGELNIDFDIGRKPFGIGSLAISPDHQLIAVADQLRGRPDVIARIYKAATGERVAECGLSGLEELLDDRHITWPTRIHVWFSADSKLIAAQISGFVAFWDAQSGKLQRTVAITRGGSLILSPEGSPIGTIDRQGTLSIGLEAGRPTATFPQSAFSTGVMAISHDARRLATVGKDGTILIWEVPPLGPLPEHR